MAIHGYASSFGNWKCLRKCGGGKPGWYLACLPGISSVSIFTPEAFFSGAFFRAPAGGCCTAPVPLPRPLCFTFYGHLLRLASK